MLFVPARPRCNAVGAVRIQHCLSALRQIGESAQRRSGRGHATERVTMGSSDRRCTRWPERSRRPSCCDPCRVAATECNLRAERTNQVPGPPSVPSVPNFKGVQQHLTTSPPARPLPSSSALRTWKHRSRLRIPHELRGMRGGHHLWVVRKRPVQRGWLWTHYAGRPH